MVELAEFTDDAPLSVKVLSEGQDISPQYLARILQDLTKAGLVTSVRGPRGGYQLAQSANEISVLDIWHALDEVLDVAPCIAKPGSCTREEDCRTGIVWRRLHSAMYEALDQPLSDLF